MPKQELNEHKAEDFRGTCPMEQQTYSHTNTRKESHLKVQVLRWRASFIPLSRTGFHAGLIYRPNQVFAGGKAWIMDDENCPIQEIGPNFANSRQSPDGLF
jgi:hypothetical protein